METPQELINDPTWVPNSDSNSNFINRYFANYSNDNTVDVIQKERDELESFLNNCSEHNVPFRVFYQKRDGSSRDINCSNWKWKSEPTHISVYDIDNKGMRTLLTDNILEWGYIQETNRPIELQDENENEDENDDNDEDYVPEEDEDEEDEEEQEDEEDEEEDEGNKRSWMKSEYDNDDFRVVLDGLYECVGWKWDNDDYDGAMSMMNHMQRVMMDKIRGMNVNGS